MMILQENKELLLKDLSARLPYGVKFTLSDTNIYTMKGIDLIVTDKGNWEYVVTAKGITPIEIKYIKPYLRPMSSMTEEEDYEWNVMVDNANDPFDSCYVDFCNRKHLDYRYLIPKGLAIEAPEGMYKIE